ncbi:hypothetical protein MNBD_GAMMA12-1145 [hydrothermal vent metagenome]|uniref:Uncharacterized protein n=1 Tax=hydrothermal vent metagenome TaxID=652676 RepID=A0A3B0XTC5_9ZZZZ
MKHEILLKADCCAFSIDICTKNDEVYIKKLIYMPHLHIVNRYYMDLTCKEQSKIYHFINL